MKSLAFALMMLFATQVEASECTDLSGPSSWIGWVCFADGMLSIQMQGKTYNFCNAPYSLYSGIINAGSPGSYYDTHIRGRYRCAGY